MYKIQTLNKISNIIYEKLSADKYTISDQDINPNGILVRSANLHSMEFGEELLAIARAGAGVNTIPIERCSEQGVAVFNTPGANANAVKEMVICSMIMASRNVADSEQWTKSLKGKGDEVPKLVEKGKSQFSGPEILGKKLGVIGLGAIGGLVANAASSLGMEVVGCDPYLSVNAAWQLSRAIKQTTEEELLATCDYVSFHIPLTPQTKGIINEEMLNSMKKGATILNFSRAGLADSNDVISALESGQLKNYVVDFPTDEMIGVKGALCLPHLASSTPESEDNCAVMASDQLSDYLENGNIKNSVNFPECTMPRSSKTRVTVVHHNVPNTIGSISSKLAEAGINIANMMGTSKKDISYTLFEIDDEINDTIYNELCNLDDIIKVRVIR